MGPKDVIRNVFRSNDYIMNDYLKDLNDEDLLVRAVPTANHIAWQLGHLIKSEVGLSKYVPGAVGAVKEVEALSFGPRRRIEASTLSAMDFGWKLSDLALIAALA